MQPVLKETDVRPARPFLPGVGESAVAWLRGPREEWAPAAGLTHADLDRTAPFPWPNGPGHTVAPLLARVNAEPVTNVSEIG